MKRNKNRLLAAAAMLLLAGCGNAKERFIEPSPEFAVETAASTALLTEAPAETEAATRVTVIRPTEAPSETQAAETEEPTEETTAAQSTASAEEQPALPDTPETPQPTAPPIAEVPPAVPTPAERVVTGTVKLVNNCMVVDSGTPQARAIELFSGNWNNGTRFAQTLNSYKTALGDAVNVYCMVVPTSQAFYTPDSVAGQYGDQLAHYENIAASLDGVVGVPVYQALEFHAEEYLYSRTDYHWQPLAAYYAAEQFAQTAAVPFPTLDNYDAVTREGYVGAFYAVNKIDELANAPDTFTYYKPRNSYSCTYYDTSFGNARSGSLFFENNSLAASYTVFVGTDECILQVDTDTDNDRVLVIFKDSYGNALVPFLTQSFSKIYLCDFRYFNRNAVSFAQEVGATDMLFAMSTVACTTSGKVDLVASHLY